MNDQFLIGRLDVLGDDTDIGENWHEIGVTAPTRHDMHMKVIGNTGAGNLAEVHADIKPLRTETVEQHAPSHHDQLMHFERLGIGEIFETTGMAKGRNHQMVKVAFVGFETPEIPLFLIVLFIFALGFLLGLLVASLEMIRLRREATQARKALVNAQAGAKLSEPEPPSSSSAEVN